MKKVLWVEDDARFGLAQLAGPVYIRGGYDLVVVSDITTAVAHLRRDEFDAVVFDIRLPPGSDPAWQDLYSSKGSDKVHARLGLHLLHSLFDRENAQVALEHPPAWLRPNMVGIFTVESEREIIAELEQLGIEVYQQKTADLPDTILLEIVERILHHTATQ